MRILGDEHPSTLMARANLASSYQSAGRTSDAITLKERVLADRVRILGDEHPDTLTARANLAGSYGSAGRTADPIELEERVVADCVRILGDEHPNTLMARANLAGWYWSAGRTDAIELQRPRFRYQMRQTAPMREEERSSSVAATIRRACSTNWSQNACPGESSMRTPVSYDQWRLFSGSSTPPSVPCEAG